MNIEHHIPNLTHLREFANARSKGRSTHVARDREQVTAPATDRFFGFAYEPFLTGVIEYVGNGLRGDGIDRAVDRASDRMKQSYQAARQGMVRALATLAPTSAGRRQRSVIVLDPASGDSLVSLRIHLVFEIPSGPRCYAFMYFPEAALTDVEIAIMDTAVALAGRQIDPSGVPVIINVRQGVVHMVDSATALTRSRIDFLVAESQAYRAEWVMAS